MENIFLKCEHSSHGLEVGVKKDNEKPNNSEFTFSIWMYGEKTKPSFKQRWDYFWKGENDMINNHVVMDLNKVTELSKYLTSNIDKINVDIKKHNSSKGLIKDLIKKSEENMEKILKKKPKKFNQPTKQQVEKEVKEIKDIITKSEKVAVSGNKIEKIGELVIPSKDTGAGFQGGEPGDGLSGFRG
jgi:arsenate reductase-like glutaredoxin family protein